MFAPNPTLDHNYTVYGRVIPGMDAVDTIAPGEPPAAPTKIVRANLGIRLPHELGRGAMRVDLFDFDLPPSGSRCGRRGRATARGCCRRGRRDSDRAVLDLPGCFGRATCWCSTTPRSSRRSSKAGAGRRASARRSTSAKVRANGRRSSATPSARASATRSISASGVHASVVEKAADGSALLHFHGDEPVELLLERAGRMPLPPYIASRRAADEEDRADYQTMFAREEGAVAAPTAALHFTPRLIDALERAGSGAKR